MPLIQSGLFRQGLFLVLVFLLTGCRAPGVSFIPSPSATPPARSCPTPTVPQPSSTPTPSPSPSSTPTPRPSPSPTVSPSPTPILALCAPLPIPPDHWRLYRSRGLTPPPTDNPDGGHQGVDFTYWEGTYGHFVALPIRALLAGQVVGVERGRFPYGNAVMIATRAEALSPTWQDWLGLQPGEALYVLYAHLAAPPSLALGQAVDCGQVLGQMGCSGNCGNPHLHLEVRRGPAGETFPQGWTFQSRQHTPASDQAYRRWRFEGPFTLLDPWAILLQAQERGLLAQP